MKTYTKEKFGGKIRYDARAFCFPSGNYAVEVSINGARYETNMSFPLFSTEKEVQTFLENNGYVEVSA